MASSFSTGTHLGSRALPDLQCSSLGLGEPCRGPSSPPRSQAMSCSNPEEGQGPLLAPAEPRPGSQSPVDQPDVGTGRVNGVGLATPNPVDCVGASVFPKGMGLWPGEGRAGAGVPRSPAGEG